MKLVALLLAALPLLAQGPWRAAPNWWMTLHAEYLDQGAGVIGGSDTPGPPPPVFSVSLTKGGTIICSSYPSIQCSDGSLSLLANPANPTVSFAPQGAKVLETLTGKRIQGVGIYDLIICSPMSWPVQGGAVYQLAVDHGIQPISPMLATPTFRETARRNWREYALMIARWGSLAIPVAGSMGYLNLGDKAIVGLLGGHVLFDDVRDQIKARIPDPGPVLGSLLSPNDVITFTGGCHESLMVTRYTGKNQVSGTFRLP